AQAAPASVVRAVPEAWAVTVVPAVRAATVGAESLAATLATPADQVTPDKAVPRARTASRADLAATSGPHWLESDCAIQPEFFVQEFYV
ncbi:hypothetical protein, partial [Mycobacterium kansasii]